MPGLRTTFLLAAFAMALRLVLHWAGVAVAPFGFVPVHLLTVVLACWLSGHYLLRRDPSLRFGDLLRTSFASAMVYALLIALFTWFFYAAIEPDAFSAYNDRLVQGLVAQGHPVDAAREKVDSLYNGGNYAALTFFGLLMDGALNALVFSLLHDKVLRRFRRSSPQ